MGSITNSMDMSLSKLRRRTWKPGVLQYMGLQRVEHDLVTEQQPHKKVKEEDQMKIFRFKQQSGVRSPGDH